VERFVGLHKAQAFFNEASGTVAPVVEVARHHQGRVGRHMGGHAVGEVVNLFAPSVFMQIKVQANEVEIAGVARDPDGRV
jgi:hypothetical protein